MNNAIKKSIKELEEDITEVAKTATNKTLGKKVVKRLKSTLNDLYKIYKKNTAKIVKEKTITKPIARLFKNEFSNIDLIPSKKKSSKERQKIRFGELDNANINEINKTKRKREHYKALGDAFKEIYITDNVNNEAIMKLVMSQKIQKELIDARQNKKTLNVHFEVNFEMLNNEGESVIRYYRNVLNSVPSFNVINTLINDFYDSLNEQILISVNQSQLVFSRIIKFTIRTTKINRRVGGSYIPLPEKVQNSNSCINVKNEDNRCFEYSILASKCFKLVSINGKTNPKVYKKHFDKIKIPENQKYPIDIIEDIPKYEELNKLRIMVYVIRNNMFDIEYKSESKYDETINLYLIEDEETENKHFSWIKNISRMRNHLSTDKKNKKYDCDNCYAKSYKTQEKLDEHMKLCMNHKRCLVELPKEGQNTMKFINQCNEFKHPFDIQADFESTLLKVSKRDNQKDIDEGGDDRKTNAYQKHVPNSFGLKYNCIHDKYSEPVKLFNSSNPEEVCKKWVEEVERLAKKSYDITQLNKDKIFWKDNEKELHDKNIKCCNCECKYDINNYKVAHHDHINGIFINSLCNECNLRFKYKKFLPVYLHNLKGYDSHLFIKSLYHYGYQQENNAKHENITCIPNNEEKYISFSKKIKVGEYTNKDKKKCPIMYEIRFIDTFAFMLSSIDSLTNNLKAGCTTTKEFRKAFKNTSNEFKDDKEFNLMIQKGVYPYDYIDNYDKLNTLKLPKIKHFYSKLTESMCKQEDYDRAHIVWNTFKCKSLMDYHNLYLKSDVLLLSDIWSNFREVCYKNYGLDCTYYYTSPSLAWDAMLKKTKVELELLTDNDKVLFVENGIRGGLSIISKRHAKANNEYIDDYDKSKEESYITYLDANNLYGGAMSEYLPFKGFEWDKRNWTKEKIMDLDDKGDNGFTFCVDLHIPEDKHDYFNGYVPLPVNKKIKKSELNDWQQKDYNECDITKLCCSLEDRKEYVVHYRMLKLALSLGFELTKVHKCLTYKQKPFLKEYIDLNTALRTKAKSDFEKDFYKLMNNSVFGKTMENVRNRIDFKLIASEEKANRLKNVNTFTIFNDDLVGVHIQKQKVKMNKPIYIGHCVLDDSKYTMIDFHYNFMKKKFKNIELCFSDTDSVCYHIKNDNVYDVIKDNINYFDLSNYPENHKLFDTTNKKVVNKFKNESIAEIKEFVGLRSKLYSYITNDDEEHKKCKGVKKYVVKKYIRHANYKNTLLTRENFNISQNVIRSYGHQLYSETTKKIALSAYSDKEYILDDNIHTLTHGHYKIGKK